MLLFGVGDSTVKMACCRKIYCCLVFIALLPALVSCIRPFRVPRNLFRQGTSSLTLPEGVRIIRRETSDDPILEATHDLEEQHIRSRFRRNSQPDIDTTTQALGTYDNMYMYWPDSKEHEHYVFLLAKEPNPPISKASNPVYVSTNYGRNFTKKEFINSNNSTAVIDQIYFSKVDPTLAIFTDVINKVLHRTDDLQTFNNSNITWVPTYITFHPWNPKYVMGYDNTTEKLYVSSDEGKSFSEIQGGGNVKSFNWGVEHIDAVDVIFVEQFQRSLQERLKTKDNRTKVTRMNIDGKNTPSKVIAKDVDEFEMMKNYQFYTTKLKPSDKNPVLKVSKERRDFKLATFPSNEESRDFFVFDVVEDRVFVVINHLRNLSNMYQSDSLGVRYQLSLPRVLYHNPYTDVSSAWLRTVVPYAFVDVDRIKSVRGVYVATQLTPGPVGRRHLLSLITYNNGGKWQRIRSPTVDNRGVKINCYLPSCSIHVNLLYGAVYRVSPSERLLSSESAPGLVLALGVASTNLKIYPDVFVSSDGGVVWNRALRGKHLFTYGDHGGVIVAVPYRRYTRSLKYSTDGGFTWKTHIFSPNTAILARDIVTQPGERLPVFVVLASRYGRNRVQNWTVFYLNMTNIMGPDCTSSAFSTFKDGCILGQQQEFETRNWTVQCQMGRDYNRSYYIRSCPCSRDDFTCDYGFQRKNFDEECTPIRSNDLNNELIPKECPEGSFYNRTQGFRKIEGNKCVGGTEKDFFPVRTPCPVQELENFTLSSPNVTDDGKVAVETGGTVFFNTTFVKGNQANVYYKWYFGDEHDDKGDGVQFASRSHLYHKAGRYHVVVVAHNERSTLVEKMEVYVQDKLMDDRVSVNFHPKNPGMDEDVIFSLNLNYSVGDFGKVKYKWKYDTQEIDSWQQVVTLGFNKAQKYDVNITAMNLVSSVTKVVHIEVINKDVVPQNVAARFLGPTRIKITWKHAGKTGIYVIRHKVFMSSSGNTGFRNITCASFTALSCIVGNLLPATTYYFKVSSVTADKESTMSNIAFATTNTSAPGAPRDLRVYPVNSSAIKVSWIVPEYPNGKITSYTIRYWPYTNTKVQSIDNGLKRTKLLTGLAQDTVYFFEVYANSGSGRSIAAGPKQALTKLSKPVLPPQNIQMISDNGTCAWMRWSPPNISAIDQRPFPAKGYKVQLQDKPLNDVGSNFAMICGLTPGQKSEITIWAYSEAGEGPKATVHITTQVTKPGAPRNLKASAISSAAIKLTWEPPLQDGRITGYIINQLSPFPDTKPIEVGPVRTFYVVHKLEAYVIYKFVISAKNQQGSSVKSSPASAKTYEKSPDIVEYVTTETIPPTSASIKVTWSKPSKPNGKITYYKIRWGKTVVENVENTLGDPIEPLEKLVEASHTAYTFKHLSNNTYYSFVVIAVNAAGEGIKHINPKRQRTDAAIYGTERLKMIIEGAVMTGDEAIKIFTPKFYSEASRIANIADDRIADVVVKERGSEIAVYFDLIPRFNKSGVPLETAKESINEGFKIDDWLLASGSLSLVSKVEKKTRPTGEPSVGARKDDQPEDAQSKVSLAVLIPLVIIGLLLGAGLLFFFVKYKNLQKNFSKLHEKEHDEDEMTVYHEDMQADSPDVIFSDRSRKGKKFYKDSEKVPLGDHDELSMI